ncbi:MAG: electron transport complex subunit RsxE [Gammaproteobacteria bacterium]|nr:electron transport complex subunit RsxE [Gammaproteobacteria bacterium]
MSTLTAGWRAAWRENPATVQLLGLCPLLAVSHSTVNAIGLAAATVMVLVGSNGAISLLRSTIPPAARLPAYMLVISGFTTIVVMLLEAFAFDLYERIALFLQIIVTNCVILARAERVASRVGIGAACSDGLFTGLGFAAVLITLGAVREVLGRGTLFAGMDALFGPAATDWQIALLPQGALVAALPPGAFIVFGLLLALGQSLRRP